ncbi:hypothetical protein QJS66_12275 [Kocuria rhizophila]|nr:hypothetical protein QJS66_12275 [Kocuria rhizophila]
MSVPDAAALSARWVGEPRRRPVGGPHKDGAASSTGAAARTVAGATACSAAGHGGARRCTTAGKVKRSAEQARGAGRDGPQESGRASTGTARQSVTALAATYVRPRVRAHPPAAPSRA